MPTAQKRSILIPVIKREGLDPTDPGNFRPIANVSFISKVVEKIIVHQLFPYLEANNLIPAIQSGFRNRHSTETLLLRSSRTFMGGHRRFSTHFVGTFQCWHSIQHCRSWNIIGAIANIFQCDWCIPLLAGIIPWGVHSLCPWAN